MNVNEAKHVRLVLTREEEKERERAIAAAFEALEVAKIVEEVKPEAFYAKNPLLFQGYGAKRAVRNDSGGASRNLLELPQKHREALRADFESRRGQQADAFNSSVVGERMLAREETLDRAQEKRSAQEENAKRRAQEQREIFSNIRR